MIYIELFITFFFIGLFTIGGGYAMLSLIQTQVVTRHAWITESVIGLAFTIANPYWMRNIYKRMMLRRYENLDGFHSTR